MLAHLVIIGAGVIMYTFRSQAVPISLPEGAQFVELYELSEIPEPLVQETNPITPQEEDVIALQDISEKVSQPTPTPMLTPTPTPTPVFMPTPTPKPMATSTPRPILIPKPLPTATPLPYRTPVQPQEEVASLDIPRRKPVIQTDSSQQDFSTVLQKPPQQDTGERQPVTEMPGMSSGSQSFPFSHRLSAETPMTFETENVFPYPGYLEHIKEKIEGLWFPEGAGNVSIYLIIERDGKILKSGVDKGTGVGVDKLRESVIRAIAIIKRFEPLPEGYESEVLRVRIAVRR
jgi:hypothetical protein